ncbi:MAG: DCC1-like thiol-disulfide oxidoreductase family protein [Leptolyngbya sp.]|nr:DCC1-like thiol-disulfide oxidoreductase family protein [Leptolyngbya sp.]
MAQSHPVPRSPRQPFPSPLPPPSFPIAFFDGECLLCNGFVDWLMRLDRRQRIRLAPLQGTTAREYLPPLPPDPEQWSIFYLNERGIYSQSDAVLQICRTLGGLWGGFAIIGGVVPRGLRNGIYRWVARNRYRWFGKRDTCRMPTAADRDRFLP